MAKIDKISVLPGQSPLMSVWQQQQARAQLQSQQDQQRQNWFNAQQQIINSLYGIGGPQSVYTPSDIQQLATKIIASQGMVSVDDLYRHVNGQIPPPLIEMILRQKMNLSYDPQRNMFYDPNSNVVNLVEDGEEGEVKTKRPLVTFESVIISEHKKQEILAAISQAKHHDKIFEEWGFKEVFEKGTAITLLFWGIPGTGKTLTAQAIADHLGSKLKTYSTAEIETSEPGGAERNIKEIFARNKPKGKKKAVILFDECDSLLMDRNEVGAILGAQVNALLTEIETFDGIIIFTTNRLGRLDPALERRISAKIEFEFPNEEQRLAIWKRMIPEKAPLHDTVNLEALAKYKLAGGHIKNAVLNAARQAAYSEQDWIHMDNFTKAAEKELESIKAFLDEFNKNVHQHNYGRRNITDNGEGLSVSKNALMSMKKAVGVEGSPQ